MLSSQTEGLIHIIADNAKYYHSQVVKDFIKEHPRIHFVFLPPYSPNLNTIERLWHILKKCVVYNKFYEKFSDFKAMILDFFEKKLWKSPNWENISTDNFHIQRPDFSVSFAN